MPRINRRPVGFLKLIDSKTQGDNPSDYLTDVRPTIEMTPMLESESLQIFSRGADSSAVAGQLQVVVPRGETWKILGASMQMFPGSAQDKADLIIELRRPAGGVVADGGVNRLGLAAKAFASDSSIITDAGAPIVVTYSAPYPFWIRSGTILQGGWTNQQSGPTQTFSFDLAYFRYEV